MEEPKVLIVDSHYNGPPDSGNGGYTCGLVDTQTDYLSEVTLRKPIPLDRPLHISASDSGHEIKRHEEIIATARPGDLTDLNIPDPVSFKLAEEASQQFIGNSQKTAFPTCFVCGEDRASGEGLHIFAGRVAGTDLYAAPWVPAENLVDESNLVRQEFIWAALDCPGAYASLGDTAKPILLGRMTAQILKTLKPNTQCVVMAWLINRDGRKSWSGTALFDHTGELVGKAKAIWFEV
ncbi:MAG: hypothetical protein AAF741_19355 [Bacteroidota bacterium]